MILFLKISFHVVHSQVYNVVCVVIPNLVSEEEIVNSASVLAFLRKLSLPK